MNRPLRSIRARNFRSLADVDVDFGDLNVLIGPNGSGKSNLLRTLAFVRDTARFDIRQAIDHMGGFHNVIRQADDVEKVELTIEAVVTEHSSARAQDVYALNLQPTGTLIEREERFTFKRIPGRGRRYTVTATGREVAGGTDRRGRPEDPETLLELSAEDVSALGTLARVGGGELGRGPSDFFSFLSRTRYLDPDVDKARVPSRISSTSLADDATNLSAALITLRDDAPDSFRELVRDLGRCLPGLEDITFQSYGGSTQSVVIQLKERGLSRPVDLADASFGTVRMLALLVALHEPNPPALTVIEEVDHGLHPYALDVLVDRMRDASDRTQLLVASHSPTLVNRLRPAEIIVCDRDPDTGESLIPATSSDEIASAIEAGDWKAGELWFSGVLDGVPR